MTDYSPRLKVQYKDKIANALMEEFSYKNRMQLPKLDKIVLNIGCGREAVRDTKKVKSAEADLAAIAGQKPVVNIAKKSIAGFKLREGNAIGAKVTLRGDRMYEFLDRLINLAIPRVRDFRGLSLKSFDGNGNYTFGVTEQLIFPEIEYDKIDSTRGMDITIVTTANNDQEGRALLDSFSFPFQTEGN